MHEKTVEEYCRVIDKLDSGEGVRSVSISKALGLAKNTVALTLKKLSESDYIRMERYGKVKLSKNGLVVAKKMNFRHRVIESFLFSKLKIDKKTVHKEACAIEHCISDTTISRLYNFIGRPKTDPHGRKI